MANPIEIEIEIGDEVTVHSQGFTVGGDVLAANNYGTPEKPEWYLEFINNYWGLVYWKQGVDDGYLVSVTSHKTGQTIQVMQDPPGA
jgi:hypothetical protein